MLIEILIDFFGISTKFDSIKLQNIKYFLTNIILLFSCFIIAFTIKLYQFKNYCQFIRIPAICISYTNLHLKNLGVCDKVFLYRF